MNEAARSNSGTLPLSVVQDLDRICDRFEQAWQAVEAGNPPPRLEDYVAEVGAEARPHLLRELIPLDIAYRRDHGQQPQAADYQRRFPDLDPAWLAGRLAEPPAEEATPAPVPPPFATPGADPTGTPRVRCPHCHNPIQLADSGSEEVLCPGCGSSFRVRDARQTTTTGAMRPLGKFQLLERVGLGAFGAVWRARDTVLDRVVALKIPHTGLLTSEVDLERFHREARAAAQLRHPGIVTVHEVQTLEGLPVIVADFVEGVPLRDLLEVRPLTFREAAALLAEVAEAVDYAHGMGLVHRDLKPANIMMEYPKPKLDGTDGRANSGRGSEGLGRPLVMDFGLALRGEAEVTMTQDGHILGTPAYMSPEQAAGQSHQADRRSDVYSLGAILYELLTGQLPFRGNARLIIHQVLHEEPRQPRKFNDKIPRDLETICLKAMGKVPGWRYATARELAEDLRRFLEGEPIQARPAGWVERALKWARRRPAVAALMGLTAALLVGGMVGGLWYAQRKRARADLESGLRQQAEADRTRAEQAEGQAREEEQKAKRKAAEAQAVLAFLQQDLLRQADPTAQADTLRLAGGGLAGNENPTIKELLDRAAAGLTVEKIEAKFPRQPEVQASILRTVGDTYRGIGAYDKAVEFLARSSNTYRHVFGADDPHTLTTLNDLGHTYWAAGRTAEAIALLEQMHDAEVKKLGADHPETLTTLANLAEVYRTAGRTAEAITLFEQVRDAQVKKLGADHPSTLTTLNNLAEAYQAAGKLEQALPLFEQAARGVEKRQFVHQYAGRIIGSLSTCREQLKQYEPAEAWRRKWLAVVRERAGPESAAYAGELAALGNNLLLQRKHAEAEQTLRDCLALRAKQEPDAWTTFNTKSLLGGALVGQQKYAEAAPLLKEGYEGMKQRAARMPPRSRQVLLTEALERLVRLSEATGEKEEAARWRQELDAVRAAAKADKK